MNPLNAIPSVDSLLNLPAMVDLEEEYGHAWCLQATRQVLDEVRSQVKSSGVIPPDEQIVSRIESLLAGQSAPTLRPVINATGVVLHTNLGRAPLSESALQEIVHIAGAYSTLEYDLEKGLRGKRDIHAADLLVRLTGAEAALVVNNNAGAVMLVLAALANRKKVAISRSQLVEIGGGFRIPEVMRLSGAKLVEIGTTNRTHISDYETAIEEGADLVLLAHQSNFKIVGFTTSPGLPEITRLAHEHDIPVVHDLGSGALIDPATFGLEAELTVQNAIDQGVDLVCFSGDKLLGGPQAGIIVGKADLIDKIRKHPFYRALRADKLCLAALSATLLEYLKGRAVETVPVLVMLALKEADLKHKAEVWQKELAAGQVLPGESMIGGGSLPGQSLPTWLLALRPKSAKKFSKRLRQMETPIITRIEDDQVLLDPRTVLPAQEAVLLSNLKQVLSEENNEERS
ncbi:MAG: L-seryl-tRNA(Sec) selenium transferase [Anaerolineaceae bacterium]|jgi:L-seryl-tRNA(Ser) seleniumtransferase|nr:L-seryl-tRNA(Sec) selenium transferase [Anaerolineaceae bacterium]MDD4043719.1 L-seryl-tRNA(Sec) selenium transferase [Anaerolineaceae bacterium]MDD4578407.1 L-seryl-tRNA(Sec) selenium transferase [Anaerolineaceae bacterium]